MRRVFGVDLVIDAVARQLAARGHAVTVYASVIKATDGRPYRLVRTPTRASRIPHRYEAAARYWAGFIDEGEHDVVFIESYPFFSLIPRLRTPAIAVDHGVASTIGMPPVQRLAFGYIERAHQRRYFPRAAAIITVSDFLRTSLPEPLAGSARVIYKGVDHYPAAPPGAREEMRARLRIRPDEVLALYVGRLNPEGQPYKGTRDLMAAARAWRSEAPGIRVVMAGRGSEEDARRIREAGGVPLLDAPEDDMAALYASADMYLTASRWEGFDLPLMEAAFQGVPAVALRVGAHPEVVRDGETGILAGDLPGLLLAGRELAADPGKRRALGEAARAHAQTFTWARAADAYDALVKEVAKTPVREPAPASVKAIGCERTAALEELPERALATDGTAVVLNYGASYDV